MNQRRPTLLSRAGFGRAFTPIERPAVSGRECAAFTLIELMISIAIVLVLMLGINFVFGTSAKTISTGMATSAVNREMRNARNTMVSDFDNSVLADEMPALIIHNQWQLAFRDKRDKLADLDPNVANFDADGDSANGDEEPVRPNQINFRNHRVDRISYFTSNRDGLYRRQTGDANTYIGTETTSQAWIHYALGRLADNTSGFGARYWRTGAGTEQTNPNNHFASQWKLLRKVTLLKEFPQTGAPPQPPPTPPRYVISSASTSPPIPLFFGTTTDAGGVYQGDYGAIQESRLDFADTSIERLRQIIPALVAPNDKWWLDPESAQESVTFNSASPVASKTLNYLFWAKSFVDKTDASNVSFTTAMRSQTAEAARTTPIFVSGCTQFVVEFAGDFYDQGPIAGVHEAVGTIDYDVDTTVTPQVRRTRWYGAPRDLDGDGVVGAYEVNPVVTPARAGTPRWRTPGLFFEKAPANVNEPYIWAWGPTDPADPPIAASSTGAGAPGNPNNVRPQFIRITLEITDSNSRLDEGQRIQWIFRLN